MTAFSTATRSSDIKNTYKHPETFTIQPSTVELSQ